MANGEIGSEAERVVEQLKKGGDRNVAFVPVEHLSFTGCDYHASTADDNLIREALVRVIDAKPEIWQGLYLTPEWRLLPLWLLLLTVKLRGFVALWLVFLPIAECRLPRAVF